MIKKLFVLLFLCSACVLTAQDFPDKPSNYVTDDANVLDSDELALLNAKCKSYEDSSSNQIFVYLAPTLNGNQIEDHCTALFNKWGIGQAGKDNGVLIAVFVSDHNFRIQTGYGMEGNLPDLLTKKIQDETMKPFFKKGNYFEGISGGIDKVIYYAGHTYAPEEESKIPLIIFIVIFLAVAYAVNGLFLWATRSAIKEDQKRSAKAKRIANIVTNVVFYIPFLGAFFMVPVMIVFGKRGGGGSGGSSRSGSWGGSSSGSSFSGGGGGRSGGGGSSSSW